MVSIHWMRSSTPRRRKRSDNATQQRIVPCWQTSIRSPVSLIDKRRSAAAKQRSLLVDLDVKSGVSDRQRGGDPRDSTADHDHGLRGHEIERPLRGTRYGSPKRESPLTRSHLPATHAPTTIRSFRAVVTRARRE